VPTVLITGAGRGLGYEFARQYAAEDWRVIGTVRDEKGKAALAKLGAKVASRTLDVTDRKQIARLASGLKGAPIDVLILNAGIYGSKSARLGKLDYSEWEQVMRVNVLGAAAVAEALIENVAASGRRTIVMISSRLGSVAEHRGDGDLPYNVSKSALNALAKGLAVALASRGLIVVAVSPGWVRTDMGGRSAPLAPEESIGRLRKLIGGLTREHSGGFFSHDGSSIPW
jgi:NAD(P)-dependent dehydrogenase (short-subunit alcohol dehydrogenase family)